MRKPIGHLVVALASIWLLLGCGVLKSKPEISQAYFQEEIQRSLQVKKSGGNQIVCLVFKPVRTITDDDALFLTALSELCLAYQNGSITLPEYQNGLRAAAPLLMASKAGAYFLSSKDSNMIDSYRRLLEILKNEHDLKILCEKIVETGKEPAPTVRFCRDILA